MLLQFPLSCRRGSCVQPGARWQVPAVSEASDRSLWTNLDARKQTGSKSSLVVDDRLLETSLEETRCERGRLPRAQWCTCESSSRKALLGRHGPDLSPTSPGWARKIVQCFSENTTGVAVSPVAL